MEKHSWIRGSRIVSPKLSVQGLSKNKVESSERNQPELVVEVPTPQLSPKALLKQLEPIEPSGPIEQIEDNLIVIPAAVETTILNNETEDIEDDKSEDQNAAEVEDFETDDAAADTKPVGCSQCVMM